MSYCDSKTPLFIDELENANVILKKYEALFCFTLASPLEQKMNSSSQSFLAYDLEYFINFRIFIGQYLGLFT